MGKKLIYISFFYIIFNIIFINNVYAETGNSWWVYDHTNYQEKSIISDEKHQYIEYYDKDNNLYNRHIELSNNNNTMKFIGYNINPINDFIYYPNNEQDTQSFELVIKKQTLEDAHTFKGITIFFNTTITGSYENDEQYMSGYMIYINEKIQIYEFNNSNVRFIHEFGFIPNNIGENSDMYNGYKTDNDFHLISSGTLKSYFSINPINSDFKIKIETTPSTLKAYAKDSNHLDDNNYSDDDLILWGNNEILNITPKSSTGFGIGVQYSLHGCNKITAFEINRIEMPVPIVIDGTAVEDSNSTESKEIEDCTNEDYANKHKSECMTCENETYKEEHEDICTKVMCYGQEMTLKSAKTIQKLINYIKTILKIVYICVPIILILYGTIDLIKAILQVDADKDNKIKKQFMKRCIYAVCIFFLGTLINFIFNLIGVKFGDCNTNVNSDESSISYIKD